jgi:4'-phosphopantetheinyl transferase
MKLHWLEQSEPDVPVENDWLGPCEATCMSALRIAKRRTDWRLGRWTAKRALAVYLELPAHPEVLARIEVRPAPSGEPEVFIGDQPALAAISLSHSGGRAVCAVAPPGVQLGCDLETIEPRSDAFISDYFTAEEQALVARAPASDRPWLVTLLWSAKESALKALHEGLRLDTRSVTVSLGDASSDLNGWSRLQARHDGGQAFYGWWQHGDGVIRTMVANSPAECPLPTNLPTYSPDRASRCA